MRPQCETNNVAVIVGSAAEYQRQGKHKTTHRTHQDPIFLSDCTPLFNLDTVNVQAGSAHQYMRPSNSRANDRLNRWLQPESDFSINYYFNHWKQVQQLNTMESAAKMYCMLTAANLRTCAAHMKYLAAAGFVRCNGKLVSFAICFDSLAQGHMINTACVPEPLPPEWSWVSTDDVIKGAGNTTVATRGVIRINEARYTWGGKPFCIELQVMELPDSAQIVFGSPTAGRKSHRWVPDYANFRVYIRRFKETVRLDWLHNVLKRLLHTPVNLMSLCSGGCPEAAVMLEMGWRINLIFAVEICPHTRQVAQFNYPDLIQFADCHNVKTLQHDKIPDVDWFVVTGGFPCQNSSVRNATPKWDTSIFEAGAAIIDYVTAMSPNVNIMVENVVPNPKLKGLRVSWDDILCMHSEQHQALDAAGPSSRPRLYWRNAGSATEWLILEHINPNWCLEDNYRHCKCTVPCLCAAGIHTGSPPKRVHLETGVESFCIPDERDRLNPALSAGYSNGWFRTDGVILPVDLRNQINGNSFSADSIWQFFRGFQPKTRVFASLMTADDIYAASPEKIELHFLQMEGDPLTNARKWCKAFAQKYGEMISPTRMKMPDLVLKQNTHETIVHQTACPGDVPPKLAASADYAIDELVRETSHKKVNYHPSYWICLLFFQLKGRQVVAQHDGNLYKKGDVLESLRPLKDARPVNSATADHLPLQWAEHSPDRKTAEQCIPADTKFFKCYDSANAYHFVMLALESQKFCVSTCRLLRSIVIYLMALGGSQGLAAMGTFFPAWVRHGYCFFFGMSWLLWFIQHVDDGMSFGPDEARTEMRWALMVASQEMMGLMATTKQTFKLTQKAEHVGMFWTPKGICIGDKALNFLIEVMGVVPGGVRQLQRLRGVINASISAFEFNSDEKLHLNNEIMAHLNDNIATFDKDPKHFTYWTKCKDAVADLVQRLKNQPRCYSDPSWVCSDTRSLCGVADADPLSVSWHLVSVDVADARDITDEILLDPDRCRLLCIWPKVLNKSQRLWHVFEGEFHAHHHGFRKSGKFINTCLAPFMDCKVPKYAWGADSKVTLFRLPTLHIPDVRIDHLNAKYQRFAGAAEEMAMTRQWPSVRLHVPTLMNCLADAAAEIARQLLHRRGDTTVECDPPDVDKTHAADVIFGPDPPAQVAVACLPLSLHTYSQDLANTAPDKEAHDIIGLPVELPDGYGAYTNVYTQDQWLEIQRAYATDNEEFNGVTLAQIYSQLALGDKAVNHTTNNKVKAWKNRLFFPVTIHLETPVTVLFTPYTCTREVVSEIGDNEMPTLVLVLPDKVKVRVSTVTVEDHSFEGVEGHKWSQWYLREDLQWIIHTAPTPHTPLIESIQMLKRTVWFAGLEDAMRRHIDACAMCLPPRVGRIGVGMGLKMLIRFKLIYIDDKMLSPEMAELTGYVSVLTIWEAATGITVYALRRTGLAREVAVILATKWIPYFGPFSMLGSDGDPALLGDVIKLLSFYMGIGVSLRCALGGHSPGVEQRHRFISKVLHGGEAKGNITTSLHCELYIAMAQVRANQRLVTAGATAHERAFGIKAVTTEEILRVKDYDQDELVAVINRLKPLDADFVTALALRCLELVEYKTLHADQKARYNFAKRLALEGNRTQTCYNLAAHMNQLVSINGDSKWTLIDLSKDTPPARALIRRNDVEKWVKSEMIRPLAGDRHEILLPTEDEFVDGTLVFYTVEPDHGAPAESDLCAELEAGVINESTSSAVTLHEHVRTVDPSTGEYSKTWLPRWSDPKKSQKLIRCKKCPAGCTAFRTQICPTRIVTIGYFSGANKQLTDASIYHLRSLGYEV